MRLELSWYSLALQVQGPDPSPTEELGAEEQRGAKLLGPLKKEHTHPSIQELRFQKLALGNGRAMKSFSSKVRGLNRNRQQYLSVASTETSHLRTPKPSA